MPTASGLPAANSASAAMCWRTAEPRAASTADLRYSELAPPSGSGTSTCPMGTPCTRPIMRAARHGTLAVRWHNTRQLPGKFSIDHRHWTKLGSRRARAGYCLHGHLANPSSVENSLSNPSSVVPQSQGAGNRRPRSVLTWRSASASAPTSSGGTNKAPPYPWAASTRPPTLVTTTGSPQPIAI